MRARPLSVSISLLTLGLLWPMQAHPQHGSHPAPASKVHEGARKYETENLVGIKALGLVAPGHELVAGVGALGFFERELVRGWCELELVAGALLEQSELNVPFELSLKHVFHLHPVLNPYVSVAALVDLSWHEGVSQLDPGVGATAGTYLWVNHTFGLDLEVGYHSVFGFERRARQGVAPALGVVAHF